MKCPKCKYVSHDYLESCRKCGVDLVAFKHDMGLLVRQPGVLDLSLVLGEAGADDLFASVAEEGTMHAGSDDDFALSLDADSDQPGVRRAPVGVPRAGGRETPEGITGLDHLTLELEMSALSASSMFTALPPAAPEANALPAHVTIEMEPERTAAAPPPDGLEESALVPPPHALSLEVGSIDWASPTSSTDPAERSERAQSVNEEPAESVEPTISVIELRDVDAAVAHVEAETGAELSDAEPPVEDGDLSPESALPGYITIELDTPELEADLTASLFEEAERTPLYGDPEATEAPDATGRASGCTPSDALALGDSTDTTLPGHLTLELDASEIMANWSSSTLDSVWLDDSPGDVQSKTATPQNEVDDGEALQLDLDAFEIDDDTQA